MAAAASSRSRPPASSKPPAKKARHSNDTQPSGLEAILSGKGNAKPLTAVTANGIKGKRIDAADESRAAVGTAASNGDVDMQDAGSGEVVEISSDEESSEYESDEEEEEEDDNEGDSTEQAERRQAKTNRPAAEDTEEMADRAAERPEDEAPDAAADEPPTFGDLLLATPSTPVDVSSAALSSPQLLQSHPAAPQANNARTLTAPTATSLSTVLTQALRTADAALLESCISVHDLATIRATIERLPSPLVSTLLARLAERLHRRPGRAGNLMVWVQWALVAHGGYLAAQPEVLRRLAGLNRVIRERAEGLQPLLTLKGKLDMLAAQLELRRGGMAGRGAGRGGEESEEEGAVVYVEGQEEEEEEEEGDDEDEVGGREVGDGAGRSGVDRMAASARRVETAPAVMKKPRRGIPEDLSLGSDEESDAGNGMPTTNGVAADDEDEDQDDDGEDIDEDEADEDEDDLLDDEAEETENDTGEDEVTDDEEASFDDEDIEAGDDVSESEGEEDTLAIAAAAAAPVKRSTAATMRAGRRR